MSIKCPWCTTVQHALEALLGRLGTIRHYRCRYCGGEWSKGRRVVAFWPKGSK